MTADRSEPNFPNHLDLHGDADETLTLGEVRRARLFDGLPRYLGGQAEFEAVMPARRRSVEHDFGVGWRLGLGSTWRISWVRRTGEVYCAELAPRTEIVVVGKFAEGAHVALALGDWPAVCGEPSSLEWAIARLRGSSWRVA